MYTFRDFLLAAPVAVSLLACSSPVERPPAPDNEGIYGFANGCYVLDATEPGSDDTRWLEADESGEGFVFEARSEADGARFFLKASDLGTYLLYDADGHYVVANDDGTLGREQTLLSDVLLNDDMFISPAEWEMAVSVHDETRFQLTSRRTGQYLAREGLVDDEAAAGVLAFYPAEGCTEHPELSLDAEGEPTRTTFDDGDLFGIVDTHSHLMSNFGFGGGGLFHGAPFHRLGVEHALPDCTQFHGPSGRSDLFGFGFDRGDDIDTELFLTALVAGRIPEANHATAGYPDFTAWPDARDAATHQQQYYRWLERAWRGGLRLVIQHATTNQVICELTVGQGFQDSRYSCNDMVAVDREFEETFALERYIDAQSGGPGRGWFRVVRSPAEAREVIAEGKMAVVLGIETSNLFDCFLTPREGFPTCDAAHVEAELDRYYDLGVRVMFPVHKFDNAFSAGDGNRAIIELGNFIMTGHWSNFTTDCPSDVPTVFDRGDVTFGGLNMPRADYFAPAPHDMTGFADNPLATLSPFLSNFMEGPLEGDYCQAAGLTPLGEHLMTELMHRGMVIEIDHFSRRAYQRAFEMLEENDYPAAGTHGTNHSGRLYALGGISKAGLGRCAEAGDPSAMIRGIQNDVDLIEAAGGYPAEGFGFDLNGFAGAAGPRFGPDANCSETQENPVTYPFTSYAGDVTFTEPRIANRVVDFNTEGMVHIGVMPELIEDARRGGVSDEELEMLFRSAEGYIRMWERAEERGRALSGG